jgi:hypothetical protein
MLLRKKTETMKKLSLIIIASLSILAAANSQNVDDALRYSQVFYSGTARFNSMGGAFTALGGDLSSLSLNPAGIGLFRSSELTITPQLFNFKSSTILFGNKSEDFLYDFNLGQAGIVANIIRNDNEKGLITLNIGYSFNRTNNLNQSINIEGISNKSSLLDHFADELKDINKNDLSREYLIANNKNTLLDAFLAWDTYLLDTLPGSNISYGTPYSGYGDNADTIYGQQMRRIITSDGYTGEHSFSIGGNYSDKLYFGATLGITRISYEEKYEHRESTDALLTSKFTNFNYAYYYSDRGTGYSVKFGVIYKPVDMLRLGLAFHSPTIYRISEDVSDNMTAYFSYRADPYKSSNETSRFSYILTSPFRVDLGGALQIQKFALISADYELVDYRSAKFSAVKGDNFNYSDKNQEIKNTLKTANNIRLGAEVRLKNLYLRGGYGYYGKTFKEQNLNSNMDYNSLSLGIGFREQNIYADLGFTTLINSRKLILYDSPLEEVSSNLDIKRNIFAVTFGYKFGY